jgi:hypothetical protein
LRPPSRPAFRRIAEELIRQGKAAAREKSLPLAALRFDQAAITYRLSGVPLLAAHALLELGAVHLRQGEGPRLLGIADRVEALARDPLPHGGLVKLRLFALFLRRAEANPAAFFAIVARSRRPATLRSCG